MLVQVEAMLGEIMCAAKPTSILTLRGDFNDLDVISYAILVVCAVICRLMHRQMPDQGIPGRHVSRSRGMY